MERRRRSGDKGQRGGAHAETCDQATNTDNGDCEVQSLQQPVWLHQTCVGCLIGKCILLTTVSGVSHPRLVPLALGDHQRCQRRTSTHCQSVMDRVHYFAGLSRLWLLGSHCLRCVEAVTSLGHTNLQMQADCGGSVAGVCTLQLQQGWLLPTVLSTKRLAPDRTPCALCCPGCKMGVTGIRA